MKEHPSSTTHSGYRVPAKVVPQTVQPFPSRFILKINIGESVKGLGMFIEAIVIAAKLADGTTTNERCLEQSLAGLERSVELWGSENRCP